MDELSRLRAEIDRIDDDIVDLLGRRFAICRQVAAYKLEHDVPIRIPVRIDEVRDRCVARGAGHGLDPDFLAVLYTHIIEEACRTEAVTQAQTADGPDP